MRTYSVEFRRTVIYRSDNFYNALGFMLSCNGDHPYLYKLFEFGRLIACYESQQSKLSVSKECSSRFISVI